MVPIFSTFNYIYRGPHKDEYGLLDHRVWFSIPISADVKKGSVTYLIFPYGAKEHEIEEEEINVGSWTD